MFRYIVKRVLLIIPVIIGISILIFSIMQLAPGDPVKLMLGERATEEAQTQLRQELGLNKPKVVQYFNYMTKVVTKGDFGISYTSKRPVIDEIKVRFPVTVRLSVYGILIAILVGIPVGAISAIKPYSPFDKAATVLTLIGTSIPPFWLGLMMILIFSLGLRMFPSNGIDGWISYVLPSITLSSVTITYLVRVTRSSLLDMLREDFVRTARSKGISERRVIVKHAFGNALIPVLTTAGLQFGYMLGGSVITETVFAIPGLGRLLVTAIRNSDINTAMGCCLLLATSFSLVNLAVDLLYALLDPRIKAQYSSRSKRVSV
ncbi:MAG: ABC transporter permease [Oscillospiraceae bacterium]|nr:ABC transporter permease [Oscillospiraceae bacterium]